MQLCNNRCLLKYHLNMCYRSTKFSTNLTLNQKILKQQLNDCNLERLQLHQVEAYFEPGFRLCTTSVNVFPPTRKINFVFVAKKATSHYF